jgi:hypothetical protein
MTDKLIDLTTRKRHTLHRCHYCDHNKYPFGKVIIPVVDPIARRTSMGDWKCGDCIIADSNKIIEGMSRRKGDII